MNTSSHTFLSVLAANGIDRIFQVPGESFLGILDALADFPAIDIVTCRHEAGAGFMACADGRLTGRPGVVMVSRGPGASNASIALHTAQQDAIPLILIVGQVLKKDLRREAFQEIDYQTMFGSVAKWVVEATRPEQLGELAFKAVRIATSGTPGPVVLVIPEDIQQQPAAPSSWVARPKAATTAAPEVLAELRGLLQTAQRPLVVAGGAFDRPGGREALLAFAQAWNIPVPVKQGNIAGHRTDGVGGVASGPGAKPGGIRLPDQAGVDHHRLSAGNGHGQRRASPLRTPDPTPRASLHHRK